MSLEAGDDFRSDDDDDDDEKKKKDDDFSFVSPLNERERERERERWERETGGGQTTTLLEDEI